MSGIFFSPQEKIRRENRGINISYRAFSTKIYILSIALHNGAILS